MRMNSSSGDLLVFQAVLRAFNPAENSANFENYVDGLFQQLLGSTPQQVGSRGLNDTCNRMVQVIFFESSTNWQPDFFGKKFRELVLRGIALAVKKWREQHPKPWCGETPYLKGTGYTAVSNFLKSTKAAPLGVTSVGQVLEWMLPIIVTNHSVDPKDSQPWNEVWNAVQNLPPIYLGNFEHNFFQIISPLQRDQFSQPPLMMAITALANEIPPQPTPRCLRLRRYGQMNGWLGYFVPGVLIGLMIAYLLALFIPAAINQHDINTHRSFGTPALSLLQVIEQTRQYIDPTYIQVILAFAILFLLLFIFLVGRTCYLHNPYQILP